MNENRATGRGKRIPLVVALLGAAAVVIWLTWPALYADRTFATLVRLTERYGGEPPPADVAELYGRLGRVGPEQVARVVRRHIASPDVEERASALYLLGSWYLIHPEDGARPVSLDADPSFERVQAFDEAIGAALAIEDDEIRRAAVYASRGLSDLAAVESGLVRVLETTNDETLREQVRSILER